LHSLRRRLFFGHEGHVRHGRHGRQSEQALCLTFLTNAVVLWNTMYMADALEELRHGADIDEAAAHLSPALMDHIKVHSAGTPSTSTGNSPAGVAVPSAVLGRLPLAGLNNHF
jgi:hypothetical protein